MPFMLTVNESEARGRCMRWTRPGGIDPAA
jgi:hypothetical protein